MFSSVNINKLIIAQLFDLKKYVIFSKTGFGYDWSIFSSLIGSVHIELYSFPPTAILRGCVSE